MTSKEWVIPPRPKPGRKPATDTPPTKRKAQNRAAQRAFRERRAARVGELEEQLQQQKNEQDKAEAELKEKIRGLEMNVQSFRSRCLLLEDMLERERKERVRAVTEAEGLRRRQNQGYSRHSHMNMPQNTLPSISSQHSGRQDGLPRILPSLETNDDTSPPLTCGNCSPNSCACAEEAMATVVGAFGSRNNDLKRPVSPAAGISDEKRQRPNLLPGQAQPDHDQQPSTDDTMNLKDGCGFCNEGTYCVCADTVMATPAMTPTADILPPITQQTQTPPPSESDTSSTSQLAMEVTADGAVKLPRRSRALPRPAASQNSSRGCGPNGPGSCAQCQADPKSGLFCRLMAAKLDRGEGGGGGGCCGGKGPDGGCCKSKPKQQEKITLPSLPSLGLTCAEAYQTLSSHRNFDRASDDIGSWLPRLRATPVDESRRPSRMPMEVEAASIMSVLKDFDVRFGG